MPPVVVDTSALMRMVQARPDAAAYREVIENAECHAPTLIVSELANAMWKTVRFAGLDPVLADHLLIDMIAIPHLADDKALANIALDIAIAAEHSVYDCLFIALGRTLNAPILTADKKLRRKFSDDTFIDIDI